MRPAAATLAALAALALTAGPPAAAQAWERPPAEWSARELRKILNDSPWAQTISTRAVWRTPGYEGPEVTERIGAGRVPADDGVSPTEPGLPPRRGEEAAHLVLRWASAWTVRAAEALEAGNPPPEHRPDRRFTEIELVLYPDVTYGFPQFRPAELQQNTWLAARSTGERIAPSRLEVRRERDGSLRSISFFFRRVNAEGESWLRPDEQQVEFVARIGLASFRARFQPRRMQRGGAPDL
jgi:hypothetical protein